MGGWLLSRGYRRGCVCIGEWMSVNALCLAMFLHFGIELGVGIPAVWFY